MPSTSEWRNKVLDSSLPPNLTVAAHRSSGGVEICVTDTGIGIPAEALTTIFEPFRQVDSSDTRKYGGVGLGLHIVKQTVELLQGTITVESEVGLGSTFRVWLPVELQQSGRSLSLSSPRVSGE